MGVSKTSCGSPLLLPSFPPSLLSCSTKVCKLENIDCSLFHASFTEEHSISGYRWKFKLSGFKPRLCLLPALWTWRIIFWDISPDFILCICVCVWGGTYFTLAALEIWIFKMQRFTCSNNVCGAPGCVQVLI